MPDHEACAVCSRTILKGEQLHEYLSPQGERFGVCVHCRSRAEESGLIPAEKYGTVAHESPARARRGQALRRRLGQAASRARATARSSRRSAKAAEPEPESEPQPAMERDPAPEPARAAQPEADAAASAADRKATEKDQKAPEKKPPQRPRPQAKSAKRQRAEEAPSRRTPRPRRGPAAIMRHAVECFNSSEEARKVAGLIRSLGEPHAAVRPDSSRQMALVTVAWELSWYQWEVGGDGDDEAVREVAKGKEVSELDEDVRAWNAAVAEDGTLRLRDGAKARQPSAKKA